MGWRRIKLPGKPTAVTVHVMIGLIIIPLAIMVGVWLSGQVYESRLDANPATSASSD